MISTAHEDSQDYVSYWIVRRESKFEQHDPYRHQVLSRGAQRSFGLLERYPDAVLSYSASLLTGLSFSAQKRGNMVLLQKTGVLWS
jgi:hypothetical protein